MGISEKKFKLRHKTIFLKVDILAQFQLQTNALNIYLLMSFALFVTMVKSPIGIHVGNWKSNFEVQTGCQNEYNFCFSILISIDA